LSSIRMVVRGVLKAVCYRARRQEPPSSLAAFVQDELGARSGEEAFH